MFFSCSIFSIHAQENIVDQNLINYPLAPETAKLGLFGNAPVSLFTGQLNSSVPVFQINENDYSQNIALNYSYSGFLLSEQSSVSGLGWFMNAGGAVIREVRGLPDESRFGIRSQSMDNFKRDFLYPFFNNPSGSSTPFGFLELEKMAKGEYDLERDKYTVSFNGINFSFGIADNGMPFFSSSHNYAVNIITNESNNLLIEKFIIRDNNGNEYHFSEKETIEPLSRFDQVFNDSFQRYINAWQVSHIVLNNGKVISFEYDDDNYTSISFSSFGEQNGLISPLEATTGLPVSDFNESFGDELLNKQSFSTSRDLIRRKLLREIHSTNFKFECLYDTMNNEKIIKTVNVFDLIKNNKVKFFEFSYAGTRNLLTEIKLNNMPWYKMEYYGNTNMPKFVKNFEDITLYKNTDQWGFLNGTSNVNYFNMPGTTYTAVKTPSLIHSELGALKKIIYPTQGFTEIEYELNSVNVDLSQADVYASPNSEINLKLKTDFALTNEIGGPDTKAQEFTIVFDKPTFVEISHSVISYYNCDIKASITSIGGKVNPSDPDCNGILNYDVIVPNLRFSQGTNYPLACPDLNIELNDGYSGPQQIVNGNSNGVFKIPAGTYKFKLSSDHNSYKKAEASIVFKFFDPNLIVDKKPSQLIGGIRVKRTSDSSNNQINNTFYAYELSDGTSSGDFYLPYVNSYNYVYNFRAGKIIEDGGGPVSFTCMDGKINRTAFFYKSFTDNFNNKTPVYYKRVIKTFDEEAKTVNIKKVCDQCSTTAIANWDGTRFFTVIDPDFFTRTRVLGGSEVYTFRDPSLSYSLYPFTPSRLDLNLGQVEKEEIFKGYDYGGKGDLIKTKINTYEKFYLKTPIHNSNFSGNYQNSQSLKLGYKVQFSSSFCGILPEKTDDYFILRNYFLEDSQYRQTEFRQQEKLGQNSFETFVKYEFDNYNQLKKLITSNSKGEFLTTQYSYPYNYSDEINTSMLQHGFVDKKVEMIVSNQDGVLEKSKNNYAQIGERLFKPKTFLKLKEPNFFEPFMKQDYDTFGNVILNAKLPGFISVNRDSISEISTYIIWGYNQTRPIAKIENATFDQVQPFESNLQALSNGTDESALIAALNALRSSLPHAMVTTYTHIPLVGVSSITDPKGLKTTYEYDSFNRLKWVKDHEENILQKYCYNYKGQQVNCSDAVVYKNVAKSSTFTKNNCGVGFTGSALTYNVAAEIYSSMISQSDADSKAQADIDTNGQNYANSNGACSAQATIYKNVAKSSTFTKNNCGVGFTGSAVAYNVAAEIYSSTISQSDADNKAQADIDTNGQNYANSNGNCAEQAPATFSYDYGYYPELSQLNIDLMASNTNHSGATYNFRIIYKISNGSQSILKKMLVLGAGQQYSTNNVPFSATEVVDVQLISLIKN